jgi:hypothetical protein
VVLIGGYLANRLEITGIKGQILCPHRLTGLILQPQEDVYRYIYVCLGYVYLPFQASDRLSIAQSGFHLCMVLVIRRARSFARDHAGAYRIFRVTDISK